MDLVVHQGKKFTGFTAEIDMENMFDVRLNTTSLGLTLNNIAHLMRKYLC